MTVTKDIAERFFVNLARAIQFGERKTHIRHNGDCHSRTVTISIPEEDAEAILTAVRLSQQLKQEG